MSVYFVMFSKQKTSYWLRISAWSSDVCSSDLGDRMGSPSVRSGPVKRLGDGGECVGDMLLDLVRGDAETGRDRSEILVAEEIRQENPTRDFRQRGDRAGVSVKIGRAHV